MEPNTNTLNAVQTTPNTLNEECRSNNREQNNKDCNENLVQNAPINKNESTSMPKGYRDQGQKSDAKVLATSWPDLIGKTRHEAEEFIKVKGYSNIRVLRKGTSASTEHDESRVLIIVDDNDIVIEEPKVG